MTKKVIIHEDNLVAAMTVSLLAKKRGYNPQVCTTLDDLYNANIQENTKVILDGCTPVSKGGRAEFTAGKAVQYLRSIGVKDNQVLVYSAEEEKTLQSLNPIKYCKKGSPEFRSNLDQLLI